MKKKHIDLILSLQNSAKHYFKLDDHAVDFALELETELADQIDQLNEELEKDPLNKQLQKQIVQLTTLYKKRTENISVENKHRIIVEKIFQHFEEDYIHQYFSINHSRIMIYIGTHWEYMCMVKSPVNEIKKLCSFYAHTMKENRIRSYSLTYQDKLFKTFKSELPTLVDNREDQTVDFINFQNQTLIINQGKHIFKPHDKEDGLKYVLPFAYTSGVKTPLWDNHLNYCLPCQSDQKTLYEYIYYIFLFHQAKEMKLEKTLILYGESSTGKSTVQEIIVALIGKENVSNFSIKALTGNDGYHNYNRARLADKILNYSSEAGGVGKDIDSDLWKQLISQEPIPARHINGDPFEAVKYAKQMYNSNRFPSAESTSAFFRRFIILKFDKKIKDGFKIDINIHNKIIANELPGIMEKVLKHGLQLHQNRKFTTSKNQTKTIAEWQNLKNPVAAFLYDEKYFPSQGTTMNAFDIFKDYEVWCERENIQSRYRLANPRKFYARLRDIDVKFKEIRSRDGAQVYLYKNNDAEENFAFGIEGGLSIVSGGLKEITKTMFSEETQTENRLDDDFIF